MPEVSLQKFAEPMKERGWPTAWAAASEETIFEQLLIMLELDAQKRKRMLQVQLVPEPGIEVAGEDADQAQLPDHYLQFIVALPFKMQPATAPDLAQLLMLINQMLPVPGFCYSEADHVIYYQYVHLCVGAVPPVDTIEAMAAMLEGMLDTFSDLIERVAVKHEHFRSMMKEVQHAAEEFEQAAEAEPV